MAKKEIICPHCGKSAQVDAGVYNFSTKNGYAVYCSKECSYLGRRSKLSIEEKKAAKSEYDLKRKAGFSPDQKEHERKVRADYYQRTKDPVKEAEIRKKNMPRHLEYCRRPEYRAKKKAYDEVFKAKQTYGEFWEAAIHLKNLEVEVDNREAKKELQLTNKSQKRKRRWIQALKATMTLPPVD